MKTTDRARHRFAPALRLCVASGLLLLVHGLSTAWALGGTTPGGPKESIREWTLDECVEAALENSHRRPASQFAVDMAEAQQRQALAGYWPQIHLKGGFQHLNESPNFLFPASSITVDLKKSAAAQAAASGKASPGRQGPPAGVLDEAGTTGLTFPIPEQDITLMDPNSFLGSVSAGLAALGRRDAQGLSGTGQGSARDVPA